MTTTNIEACRKVPLHRLVGLTNISKRAKIRCPFHPDRTASCLLFPTGGYKCFGCGSHGNSVDFVTRVINSGDEKKDFKEALEELSKYI